jgi:GT2 family glycosyltransferase
VTRDQPVPHNRWDLLDLQAVPAPSISVIIVHYDQPVQLARTHAAVSRQTVPPLEIIVADDGSRTPPDARTLGPRTRVLTQPDLGFRAGAARHLGARHSRGDILVFLDADTTPQPEFLEMLTRRIAVCRDVVAVGRRRHADMAELPHDGDPARAPELEEPTWLRDGYRQTRDLLLADGRSFRFLISAVLGCRRDLYMELGGFDERFVGYGGEDWDLGYRAWNAGAVLVHEPGAVAWHDGASWAARESAGPPTESAGSPLEQQAIRLAQLIPEPSFRGAPMPGDLPDVLVDIAPSDVAPADLIRCVHSVLRQQFRDLRVRLPPTADAAVAELYGCNVATAAWSDDQLRRARARLTVHRPLPPSAVARAMDLLVGEDVGSIVIHTDDGPAGTLTSTRAASRSRRWQDRFPEAEGVARFFGTQPLQVGPAPREHGDLAGYFAG